MGYYDLTFLKPDFALKQDPTLIRYHSAILLWYLSHFLFCRATIFYSVNFLKFECLKKWHIFSKNVFAHCMYRK